MNDRLLMNNYLMILKATVEVYVHGTIESSDERVRNVLHDGLNETLLHQSKVFDKMTQYDWYIVDNVNPNEIEKVICTLNQDN